MKPSARFALVVVSACTSIEAANDAGSDASVVVDATADATLDADADASIDSSADACTPLAISGGVVAFVDRVTTAMATSGGAGSNAASIPAASDRDAFASAVVAILSGDATCALPAPYRVATIDDGSSTFVVVAEVDASGNPTPSLFWGTYIARAGAAFTRVIVEAPHPLYDERTEHEAADLFVQLQAGTLLIAGSHRCADDAGSGCSGETDACGALAPYRISDAAHSIALPFASVHDAISIASSTPFLQLHGNAEPCPSALVSDGSGFFSDAGLTATFATALEANGVAVGRCGLGYPSGACDLCATDNVEARFTAGSAASCTQMGATYGRFVHVEQQPALRYFPDAGVAGYAPVIAAASTTFP